MEHNLHITIKQQDLETMKMKGMNIILAKPVGEKSQNVTWQVFKPWEVSNVNWEAKYEIYASPLNTHRSGTIIKRLSELEPPLQDGKTYEFKTNNTFKEIENPKHLGTEIYEILDNYKIEQTYKILDSS